MNLSKLLQTFLISFFLIMPPDSFSAPSGVAKVIILKGTVETLNKDGSKETLKKGMWVKEGARVLTESKSFVKLLFNDKSQMNLGPKSEMVIEKFPKKKAGIISLMKGSLRSKVTKNYLKDDGKKSKLFVKTKSAAMGVRGTDFVVTHDPASNATNLDVVSGAVSMAKIGPRDFGRNDNSSLENIVSSPKAQMVKKGQTTGVSKGSSGVRAPKNIPKARLNNLKKNDVPAAVSSKEEKKVEKKTEKKQAKKEEKKIEKKQAKVEKKTEKKAEKKEEPKAEKKQVKKAEPKAQKQQAKKEEPKAEKKPVKQTAVPASEKPKVEKKTAATSSSPKAAEPKTETKTAVKSEPKPATQTSKAPTPKAAAPVAVKAAPAVAPKAAAAPAPVAAPQSPTFTAAPAPAAASAPEMPAAAPPMPAANVMSAVNPFQVGGSKMNDMNSSVMNTGGATTVAPPSAPTDFGGSAARAPATFVAPPPPVMVGGPKEANAPAATANNAPVGAVAGGPDGSMPATAAAPATAAGSGNAGASDMGAPAGAAPEPPPMDVYAVLNGGGSSGGNSGATAGTTVAADTSGLVEDAMNNNTDLLNEINDVNSGVIPTGNSESFTNAKICIVVNGISNCQ